MPDHDVVVVPGVDALEAGNGPLFAVIGVFDGIHLGHQYLLGRLVDEAQRRRARPTVITFDSHPDEILMGAAPALLLDPADRIRLLGEAGVEVVVVQHFDAVLRATEYDEFVHRIIRRTPLAGILMTPDAAFGHDRRGTPEAVARLGERDGFDVVVVPPFMIDDRSVRSSDIRSAIAAGDLGRAEDLLGRPYIVVGRLEDGVIRPPMPVALPPAGTYEARIDLSGGDAADEAKIEVLDDGSISASAPGAPRTGATVRVRFVA